MSGVLFSLDVLDKAHTAVEDRRVDRDPALPHIFRVASSTGRCAYTVKVIRDSAGGVFEWVLCDCPAGRNARDSRARCHHAAAALMILAAETKEGAA